MKVVSLRIEKRQQYDSEYPNEIVGIVEMLGETGRMETRIRPKTVAAIFRLCKEDVQNVSRYNAAQAPVALDNIADTLELQIENSELKQIPF